ncbi:MAG: hypothetical protein V7K48_06185 [Nostoc sp.]|uniref:hypothetical protein n=1 Tax=Nostoc sp. TaxID=1180 RepID=UPI002FF932AB
MTSCFSTQSVEKLVYWRASRSSSKTCHSPVSSAKAIALRSALSNSGGILNVIVETEITCNHQAAIAGNIAVLNHL